MKFLLILMLLSVGDAYFVGAQDVKLLYAMTNGDTMEVNIYSKRLMIFNRKPSVTEDWLMIGYAVSDFYEKDTMFLTSHRRGHLKFKYNGQTFKIGKHNVKLPVNVGIKPLAQLYMGGENGFKYEGNAKIEVAGEKMNCYIYSKSVKNVGSHSHFSKSLIYFNYDKFFLPVKSISISYEDKEFSPYRIKGVHVCEIIKINRFNP
jgi:hypothetical protein